MPIALADFPRPSGDNGRGLHGSATPGWSGGDEGYDHWIRELVEMGIKWFKVLDDGGASLPFCEKLLAAGIFPIVRILRRDPPPNDTPEPNPGHVGAPEEKTIQRLVAAGVRYFETNNEPNLNAEWKHNAMPGNAVECAKLVALNWLFDARLILSLGGFPGLPAIGGGGAMDLMGALVTLGRQDILLEGCWLALHNYGGNRPLIFPDDPIHRAGQTLTPEAYDHGAFTTWAWWNTAERRADSIGEVNAARANQANPASAIQDDHACWREFEYYNALAMKYLGRAIPILGTAGGYQIGRRDDLRYPRVTPEAHRDLNVALFDFMQRQAPDYFFAATPWLAFDTSGYDADAWFGAFWKDALTNGSGGYNNLPTITVPNHGLGERLPVIDAVKAMQNLARRLPGAQPAPPAQPAITIQPEKPVAPLVPEPAREQPAPAGWASWLQDEPPAAREEKIAPPVEMPREPPPVAREEKSEASPTMEAPREPQPIAREEKTETPSPIEFGAPEKLAPPETFPVAQSELVVRETPPVEPPARATSPVEPLAPIALPIGDEVEWDWRLDALNVAVEPAQIESGFAYWKLVRAVYQGPDESKDSHQIFYTVVNERNEPMELEKVRQGWSDGETEAITNERGETNIPLWAGFAPDRNERGAYAAWVDGLPSDRVIGLGLPSKRHVNFLLTWRRTVAR